MSSESGFDDGGSDHVEYPLTYENIPECQTGNPPGLPKDDESFDEYPPPPEENDETSEDISCSLDFAYDIEKEAVEKEAEKDYRSALELYKRHVAELQSIQQREDYSTLKDEYTDYITGRLKMSKEKCEELDAQLTPRAGLSLSEKLRGELDEFSSTRWRSETWSSIRTETWEEDEKEDPCYVEREEFEDFPKTKLVVKFICDQIENVLSDAIAITANQHLTMNMGRGLSQHLYNIGGKEIQTEISKKHPEKLIPGEVVKSTSGKMTNCRYIYHGYLPYFSKEKSEECYQALKDLIENTLRMATEDELKTLAMVAFGTGNLEYDCERVIDIMFKGVRVFFAKHCSSLESVYFVIRPKSSLPLKKLFLLEESSYRLNSNKVTELTTTFKALENDSDIICEARFEMKQNFLQVTNGTFEQAKDIAEKMIIIWNQDHVYKKKDNPIISCFDESTQKQIHLQYGIQLKRKDLNFAIDDTSLPGTQLVHVRCDSDSDVHVTKALVTGLKLVKDNNPRTVALLVKTDGTRPWQPHIAAKNIFEAAKTRKVQHLIVRVVILDRFLYIPFLYAMMDLCS